jgi:hypothetical protein
MRFSFKKFHAHAENPTPTGQLAASLFTGRAMLVNEQLKPKII